MVAPPVGVSPVVTGSAVQLEDASSTETKNKTEGYLVLNNNLFNLLQVS
jgi:hypothetical protein